MPDCASRRGRAQTSGLPPAGAHCPPARSPELCPGGPLGRSVRGYTRPFHTPGARGRETAAAAETAARRRSCPGDSAVPTSDGKARPHGTGAGPLPWRRRAPPPARPQRRASTRGAREAGASGHNVVSGTAGRPCGPGVGSAARASAPGRPRSRAPRGQHQLGSGGCRVQCQAPGPPPGPVRRAPGERRGRGRPSVT